MGGQRSRATERVATSDAMVVVADPVLRWVAVTLAGIITISAVGLPHVSRAGLAGYVAATVIGWFFAAMFLPLGAIFAWRAAAGLRGHPARHFWLAICVSCVMFTCGNLTQAAAAAMDPPVALTVPGPYAVNNTVINAILGGLPVLLIIGTMMIYPLRIPTRLALMRFWLDMLTVLAAAFTAGIYLSGSFSSNPRTGIVDLILTILSGPVVLLVVVFVLAKLLLSGNAPFTYTSGFFGAFCSVVSGIGASLGVGLSVVDEHWFYAISATANALLLASARVQQLEGRREGWMKSVRPYSMSPYIAVLMAMCLLIRIAVSLGLSMAQWAVIIGITICVLAALLRQVVSLVENHRLLIQRDTLTRELHRLAYHDSLTELGNRRLFFERLEQVVEADRHSNTDSAVLLVDLDDFKPINDQYGHNVGDAILCEIADRMRQELRSSDIAVRLGGDEFAAILPHTQPEVAQKVAERLLQVLQEPLAIFPDVSLRVGCSIGVALAFGGRHDAYAVTKTADQAMYHIKQRGKGGLATATPDNRRVAGVRYTDSDHPPLPPITCTPR